MNKLIRDKVPEIIESKGGIAKTYIADDAEYSVRLTDKLREECEELIADMNIDEVADILEVLNAIIVHNGWTNAEVVRTRAKKLEERGGFSKKIVLIGGYDAKEKT